MPLSSKNIARCFHFDGNDLFLNCQNCENITGTRMEICNILLQFSFEMRLNTAPFRLPILMRVFCRKAVMAML